MRERKVRVLHEGQEFFLLDRGRDGHDRTIAFLLRVDETKPPAEDAQIVTTDLGEYEWIGSFADGQMHVETAHEPLRAALTSIVTRYLDEFRHGKPRTASTPAQTYWFIASRGEPVFELSRALPHGLAVMVWSDREQVEAAALARKGIESPDLTIEEIRDLHTFLVGCRNEGFAGATIDDRDPIFFCIDEDQDPCHLRLTVDAKGKLHQRLLDNDGSWIAWDGDEDVTPEADTDAADEHMISRLGEVPWLGFHEHPLLYVLAKKGAAQDAAFVARPSDDDVETPAFCPLFQDLELAQAYLEETKERGIEPVRVDDLVALAHAMTARGVVLKLHPGAHRARTATLWWTADAVALDSFSGLWKSVAGAPFEKT